MRYVPFKTPTKPLFSFFLMLALLPCKSFGEVGATEMIEVPGGVYLPLFVKKGERSQQVTPFFIDRYLVTNEDFFEFVKENPNWRRSKALPIFVGSRYLHHWKSDLDLGQVKPKAPVRFVSWFAARTFCAWKNKRLPTVAEWEYVAAANIRDADAARTSEVFKRKILNWYGQPTPKRFASVGSYLPNLYGVSDLHQFVWEWTQDFNTALVSGESRGDTALERQLYCGSGSVGAADFGDYAAFMRFGFRSSLKANYTVANLGFRCARNK